MKNKKMSDKKIKNTTKKIKTATKNKKVSNNKYDKKKSICNNKKSSHKFLKYKHKYIKIVGFSFIFICLFIFVTFYIKHNNIKFVKAKYMKNDINEDDSQNSNNGSISYDEELFLDNDDSNIQKNTQLDRNLIVNKIEYNSEEREQLLNSVIVDTTEQKYTYENMLEDINILYNLYPQLISVNNRGISADGRYIPEIILGDINSSKHILIHASIHGREYMTTLLVMKQLEYFLQNLEKKEFNNITYKSLLDDIAIHFIPMVNPDGVTISQFGVSKIKDNSIKNKLYTYYIRDYSAKKISTNYEGYLKIWKSNGMGVDINKNFDHDWNLYDGPVEPSRLNYKGKGPESEPETQAIVNVVNESEFVASIAYHAKGAVIYWDYGQEGQLRKDCYKLVKAVKSVTGYRDYSAKEVKMNPAGYSDWMVINKSIPSVTVEIGRNATPLDIKEFDTIWSENKLILPKLCYEYR